MRRVWGKIIIVTISGGWGGVGSRNESPPSPATSRSDGPDLATAVGAGLQSSDPAAEPLQAVELHAAPVEQHQPVVRLPRPVHPLRELLLLWEPQEPRHLAVVGGRPP